MPFEARMLGRTGLTVGALGIASSYGVPAAAVERAFEHGINYLYFGSVRRREFAKAVRNLAPRRDRMVLVVQTYTRVAALMGWSVERALRACRTDYADVLLLGMWNKPLPGKIVGAAMKLREKGRVRFLAVSAHHRPNVPQLAGTGLVDILHFRYNAANRGAEAEIFPHMPAAHSGMVSFTATRWGQLLDPKRMPEGVRVPTAADCYRFVLSRPEVDVCLTGPANAAHVEDSLRALHLGPMQEEELAWMRKVGDAVYGR
jgi:aryl-alcohol dehydrogenase-like predicted oxidoreductase